MSNFKKWQSIDALRNVLRNFNPSLETISYPMKFFSKVKLHGTNAGISFDKNGDAYAQKRTSIITPGSKDNFGFAGWVHGKLIPSMNDVLCNMTIFGEWCGPGIQKSVALANVEKRFFAIFAVRIRGGTVVYDPETIATLIGDMMDSEDVFILPYHSYGHEVDLCDRNSLEKFQTEINEMVDKVEECDPFVKENFGVEGIGEGLVFYAMQDERNDDPKFDSEKFMFKAKGDKHQVVKDPNKNKRYADIDPIVETEKTKLVAIICPDARLDQGIFEVFGEDGLDIRKMGNYLKWVANDVLKECLIIITDNGFEWKDVAKYVNSRSVNYLKEKIKNDPI